MRRLVLVVLFAAMAIVTGVLWSAATNVSAAVAPASELTPAAPADAAPAPVMQEGPAVTVRVGSGRDKVKVGGKDQNRGKKGRVENPGLARDPSRPDSHSMLTVDDQPVSMSDQGTSGEGNLTRIHVDADEGLTAVIGFYSTIDEDQPVNNPNTYSCKKCQGVLVCGVDPQCVN